MSDTYDVEMPDGTIIEGVPVGTTQAQLNARLGKQSAPQAAAPAPVAAPAPAPMKSGYYKAAPGEEVGPVMQFLGGAKHAWDRAAAGLQSAAGAVNLPTGESLQPLVQQGSQFVKETGPASTVGQIAGDVAMSAAPAVKLFKAVNAAKGIKSAIAAEAGLNAGYGALTADQGRGAEGAAWGAGGTLAGHGLARTMQGFKPTPEAQALMDRGVQPSLGQSMGGMANTIEQKLTSVPFVGDAINYARNRAQKEFEVAAVKEATGGPMLGFKGSTLDEATDHAKRLYESVVPSLKPTTEAVVGVQQSVRDAMGNPELTDQSKQLFAGIAQKYFGNFGQLDGEAIKRLDSEIGHLARTYAGGDPQSKALAMELWKMQNAFRTGLEAGLTGKQAATLKQANETWRNLLPLHKAASARTDERITPRALQKAMARQQRKDVTMANIDPLIDNAVKVLPSSIPDSGTAGRLAWGGGALVGGSTLGVLPQMLGVAVPAGLGATRPMQRALVGNTAWQKAAAPYDAEMAAILAAALRGRNNGNE